MKEQLLYTYTQETGSRNNSIYYSTTKELYLINSFKFLFIVSKEHSNVSNTNIYDLSLKIYDNGWKDFDSISGISEYKEYRDIIFDMAKAFTKTNSNFL